MNSKKQKKIIIILFAIAVIILSANLIYSKLFKIEIKEHPIKSIEISSFEIEKRFETALSNLGIKSDWIKKRKNKNESSALDFYVSIPRDLPITVVLNEVDNFFDKSEAKIISKEEKINGATTLKIFSDSNLKLISRLSYSDAIHRNAGNIGIIVAGIWNLSDKKIEEVLSIPEIFTVLLIPSKRSIEIIKKLEEHSKNYSVLLNDKINELEFKLSETYSQNRLQLSIRNIIGKFLQTDFFVVDNKSNLYSSSIYPFIEEEFNKRKLKLFLEDSLFNLSEKSSVDARESFIEKIKMTKEGNQTPVILSVEQFLAFQNNILAFRKVGYKFINPLKIIKPE